MKHHLDTTISPFLGKELMSITRRDAASVYLAFFCHKSAAITRVLLAVDGDCCSTSIFYGIDENGASGGMLIRIEEHYTDNADSEDAAIARADYEGYGHHMEYPDVLKVWNIVIKTTKGTAFIRHINNSNGYYDGETSYQILFR